MHSSPSFPDKESRFARMRIALFVSSTRIQDNAMFREAALTPEFCSHFAGQGEGSGEGRSACHRIVSYTPSEQILGRQDLESNGWTMNIIRRVSVGD